MRAWLREGQVGFTRERYRTLLDVAELEKLVLRYAYAMTETPVEVPDALFGALRKHFSPQQMVEPTSAIAWENYRARFDHAFGIEAEGSAEGAVYAGPMGRHASAL